MDVRSRGRIYFAVGDGIAAFVQSSVASIFCSVAASSCSWYFFQSNVSRLAQYFMVLRVLHEMLRLWAMALSSRFSAVTASSSFA